MSLGRTAEYNEVRKKEILCKLKSTFVSQFELDPPKKTFIKSKIFAKFPIKSFDHSGAKESSNCPTVILSTSLPAVLLITVANDISFPLVGLFCEKIQA